MTEDDDDRAPGCWISLGLLGADQDTPEAPLGYEAYAEVVHDPQASEPPDDLPAASLHALLGIVRGHTSTPDRCYFGQWTVWGHLIRPTRVWTFAQDAAHAHQPEPRQELTDVRALEQTLELKPGNRYQLFNGPLQAAEVLGHWWDEDMFEPHAPDLIWPQDRAWCVRRDGDSDTIVAGKAALIQEVLASPDLETRRVR